MLGVARGVAGVAIALTMPLLAAGCGSESDAGGGGKAAADKQVRIAFLVATVAAGYPKGMIAAAKATLPKLNAKMDVLDAQFDPQKQVAQCQDAITRGTYDALVVLPAASPPLVACAREAERAGIPLIAANTPIGNDLARIEPTVPGVTSQVLVPALTQFGPGRGGGAGELLPAMCAKVAGRCEIGFIAGVRALALTGAAQKGVEKVIADNADSMGLVGSCEGNYQREGGFACMQDLLQKRPGLDVLFTQSDDMALGAERAIADAGKTPGKDILIGTEGGSVQGVKNIRSGRWFGSILALAEPEGRIPIELAVKAARGEEVPRAVDPTKAVGLPLVLDQRNLGEYPDFAGQWES